MAMLNNQRVPKSNDATQRTCGIPLADAGFLCGTVDPGKKTDRIDSSEDGIQIYWSAISASLEHGFLMGF